MTKFNFDPYKALKALVEVTASHVGNDFLEVICFELKKLFEADLVFITNALDCNPITKVSVLYSTDEHTDKIFDLKGTPCELVYKDKIIIINENVKLDFEKEASHDFESYFGIPLHNGNDTCIGHISIFSHKKREISKEAEDIGLIFARKIEAESSRALLEQENIKLMDELLTLSITDGLTQVYNKRFFNSKCSEVFSQVQREITNASLMFLDLDDFKIINDMHGHETGDFVLKEFGRILLLNSRRDVDFVARIGGEEFAIISLNSDIEGSSHLAQRIMQDTTRVFENYEFKVSSSIGIAEFDKDLGDWKEVYALADKRMYMAKSGGKNRFVCDAN